MTSSLEDSIQCNIAITGIHRVSVSFPTKVKHCLPSFGREIEL